MLLVLSLAFGFAACQNDTPDNADKPAADEQKTEAPADESTDDATDDATTEDAVKIGVILVHDDNTGYDFAHIQGIKAAAEAVGFTEDQIIWKYNISEDENCYDTATDLVEQGCSLHFL